MSGAMRLPLTVLTLALLAGCQGGPRPLPNDPLVGGGPAAGTPAAGEPRREGVARARDDVPPIPPANTTTSPAALTVGAIAPSEGRGAAGSGLGAASDGVTLGGPRAKGGSTAPSPPPAETTSKAAPLAAGDSYEGLQQRLKSRGVTWQQLKMVEHDRWDFCCAIPDPKQASIRRHYEARARASAVEAMREVLAEIDSERR
jgi:hypothetical protein